MSYVILSFCLRTHRRHLLYFFLLMFFLRNVSSLQHPVALGFCKHAEKVKHFSVASMHVKTPKFTARSFRVWTIHYWNGHLWAICIYQGFINWMAIIYCILSADNATGARRNRVSTLVSCLWSFGPENIASFRLFSSCLAAASKTMRTLVVGKQFSKLYSLTALQHRKF